MISVIVPIYKVENYLVACVDSILNSTYKDLEVILVDDGSPDGCPAMCDSYAARDGRVKVVHKRNGGLSDARNAGLKVVHGDFVMFIDGDDVIHPRMLEVLHDAINSGDYDFSMVYGSRVEDKGIGYDYASDAGPIDTSAIEVITPDELMHNLDDLGLEGYQYHVVWNKLYKKSVIDGLLFKDLASEDVEWNTRVCLRVSRGILVKAELYYYIQRSQSIIHSNLEARYIALINTYFTCLNDIPAESPQYRAMALKALYSVIFMSRHMARGTALAQQVEDQAGKIYSETKRELLSSRLSWARKLRILILYHFPGLYSLLLKLRYGQF